MKPEALPVVAAVQMCSSHCVDDNLAIAQRSLAEAAALGARLVVLPEMFAIMGRTPAETAAAKEGFGSGKIQDFLSREARKHRMWLVGGTIPLAVEDSARIRAAALIFDEEGCLAARYDKMHLFDAVISDKESYRESDSVEPGDTPVILDTPVGRLRVGVCFDIRFPERFRSTDGQKTDIIALPAAFTVTTGEAHWELLARARAVENFSYLMGACQGGLHTSGRSTYGHSLIVAPWGNVVASRKSALPGVLHAVVDRTKTGGLRAAQGL